MSMATIRDHMVRYPFVIGPEQSIREALDLMQELNIRHLPVVSGEQLVGIVSERDLRAKDKSGHRTVAEVMRMDVYVVSALTPLAEVAQDMADGKFGSALVVDVNQNVIGIFTTTDALRLLAARLEADDEETYLADLDEYSDGLTFDQA